MRYGTKTLKALQANTDHRFAADAALMHYPSHSVYTFIPKNGCSTLRLSLAVSHGFVHDIAAEWTWIHLNNPTFRASLSEIVTARFTFVILRCPYSRLVSAFLDKILARGAEMQVLYRAERETFDPAELTFRSFVDLIRKPGNLRLDAHWRPQIDFLVYEDYDGWYSLEDFSWSKSEIEKNTGLQIVDARQHTEHSSSGGANPVDAAWDIPLIDLDRMKYEGNLPPHRTFYSPDIASKVSALYRADIDLYTEKLGESGLMFQQNEAIS